jgi:hypothetical protein
LGGSGKYADRAVCPGPPLRPQVSGNLGSGVRFNR